MFQTAPLTSLILLALSVKASPIVVRNTLVSLSFARQLNATGPNGLVLRDQARAKHLVSLSKAKQSDGLSADAIVGLDVTNAASAYRTSVGVGSPATFCESRRPIFIIEFIIDSIPYYPLDTLIIDTGSANTWIGAGKPYVRTNTSVQTNDQVVSICIFVQLVDQHETTGLQQPSTSMYNMVLRHSSVHFPALAPPLLSLHPLSGTEFTDAVTITPGVVIPSQSIGVASTSRGMKDVDGILG
jgi:hypothetical protein